MAGPWDLAWRQLLRSTTARPQDATRLQALVADFLGKKSFTGAAGLATDAAMRTWIAAQACLLVLDLGLGAYADWRGIVVYPGAFRVRRTVQDSAGLLQDQDLAMTGEAWPRGPVILSWDDARPDTGQGPQAAHVVLHEFAHMLDLRKGHADGAPPMTAGWHRGIDPTRWARERDDAYERFCAELDLLESELPADVDPESPAGTAHFARLPLDPYAATDPAEFFAVSSEIYFTNPARLQAPFPAWFELLDRYYRAPTREI